MIAGMASRRMAMLVVCGALILTAAARPGTQNRSTANAPPQLQTRVLGSGNPVILLGGGLLGADGWGGVPPLLAKTHRVINAQSLAVQYGLDGKPLPAGYELQTEVDALRASLDSTQVDVADIIGMSHGGVIGLVFALENPRRVRTLTLIEPPAFWVLPNHGYDDAGARQMQEFVSSLRHATITEAHVERFRCLLGDCARGRSPRQAPQWNQWVKYRNSLRGLHTVGEYNDDPSRLRALVIPTLVVNGAETVAFHRAINAVLLRTLPRAEAFELTGGHNSPASAPDYFVAEWLKFQERATTRRGRNP
jgi:pimeloyl-ACP methyl ester carboxylesterase